MQFVSMANQFWKCADSFFMSCFIREKFVKHMPIFEKIIALIFAV